MFNWIRQKFGPVVVTLIIGGIAAVFVLSDFLAPRAARQLGVGLGDAGAVNGETISASEFSRELARRTESLKQMTGGKLTDEQLKMFRVRESVFNELVQRKLVLQECRKSGILPSDSAVKAKILELPYFQKEGKFDLVTYKAVLANNRLDPGKFEDMVRDDLTMQKWMDQIRSRIRVSEDEVQREYRLSNEKRNIKYVVLDLESGRKAIQVPSTEVDAFLKDADKLARAKSRYEQKRSTQYKDKKFEDVRREIAQDLIAGERVEDVRKANQKLAEQVLPVLGSGSDARVQSLLKQVGGSVKTSGLITAESPSLPGIGDAQQIVTDAFSGNLASAKKYEGPAWVAVAVVIDTKKPDMTKLTTDSAKLEQQIRFRKERELEEEWIQELRGKAKINMNSAVVNGPEATTDVG